MLGILRRWQGRSCSAITAGAGRHEARHMKQDDMKHDKMQTQDDERGKAKDAGKRGVSRQK